LTTKSDVVTFTDVMNRMSFLSLYLFVD
jgi:hypothetical protein